jgi:DNA-binding transcriptional MerR regulator
MGILSTGELARKTGVSLRTIRWYTEAGLLSPSLNATDSKRPKYSASAIEQIQQIQLLAETGMKLSEIYELFNSIESIQTEKKARTLYLRKHIVNQVNVLSEKENRLRDSRLRLESVLQQTGRCPECPSRGENQDCGSCSNLEALETAALGCTTTLLTNKTKGDKQR